MEQIEHGHYQALSISGRALGVPGSSRLLLICDKKPAPPPAGAGVILFYPIGQSAYLLQSLQMAL